MRIISTLLIISLLHLCQGCYNVKILQQDFEIRRSLSVGDGVYRVQTEDSTEFDFINHTHKYVFQNDSLYGRAKRAPFALSQKFEEVRIPVSDISWLETRELNTKRTWILGIGLTVSYLYLTMKLLSMHSRRQPAY